ncbi:MAG TPA: NUDIX hydrolase [Thermoanaerobaculia bacterium]|jgi:ADP-ribose pyrophosphatase|nr:NUDIX hydrolase [Thermoanaerobaculia bacterium]
MKTIFEGKHLLVREHDGWEFAERKSATEAAAVVAITEDGRVVLTEQYRRAVDARVIDFPAGLVGDEKGSGDPAETAKKELEEETGFVCDGVEKIAAGPSSPGITSELVTLYRASGVRRRGEGGGVGGEDIEVHQVPVADIAHWLQRKRGEGVLIDLKVALYFSSKST